MDSNAHTSDSYDRILGVFLNMNDMSNGKQTNQYRIWNWDMYISFLSVVFYNILVYIVKIRFSGSKGFTSIIKIYYKHSIFELTCPFQPMFSDSLVVHVFMIYLLNRLLESGIVVFLLFSSL